MLPKSKALLRKIGISHSISNQRIGQLHTKELQNRDVKPIEFKHPEDINIYNFQDKNNKQIVFETNSTILKISQSLFKERNIKSALNTYSSFFDDFKNRAVLSDIPKTLYEIESERNKLVQEVKKTHESEINIIKTDFESKKEAIKKELAKAAPNLPLEEFQKMLLDKVSQIHQQEINQINANSKELEIELTKQITPLMFRRAFIKKIVELNPGLKETYEKGIKEGAENEQEIDKLSNEYNQQIKSLNKETDDLNKLYESKKLSADDISKIDKQGKEIDTYLKEKNFNVEDIKKFHTYKDNISKAKQNIQDISNEIVEKQESNPEITLESLIKQNAQSGAGTKFHQKTGEQRGIIEQFKEAVTLQFDYKNKTVSLNLPSRIMAIGYYADPRQKELADMITAAQAVKAMGTETMTINVNFSDEKTANQRTMQAIQAGVEAGFSLNELKVMKNGQPVKDIEQFFKDQGKPEVYNELKDKEAKNQKILHDASPAPKEIKDILNNEKKLAMEKQQQQIKEEKKEDNSSKHP